jgi:hypothetical protein
MLAGSVSTARTLGVDLHGYSILQEWRLRTANFLRLGFPIRLVRDFL